MSKKRKLSSGSSITSCAAAPEQIRKCLHRTECRGYEMLLFPNHFVGFNKRNMVLFSKLRKTEYVLLKPVLIPCSLTLTIK